MRSRSSIRNRFLIQLVLFVGIGIYAYTHGFLSAKHVHIPTWNDLFHRNYSGYAWVHALSGLLGLALGEVGVIYLFVKKRLSRTVLLCSIPTVIILALGWIFYNFTIIQLVSYQ